MKTPINGIDLTFDDVGQGRALMFVHGYPLCGKAWQKQVQEFKQQYRVITPDLRGLGDSGTSEGTTTMDQFAADLQQLLTYLKVPKIILVGHSMGGYVALAFARKYPTLLEGLVLVGTRAGQDSEEAVKTRRETAKLVALSGTGNVVDSMMKKMISPKNAIMANEVLSLMASTKPQGVVSALLGMAERPESFDVLKNLEIPVLIITGADDTLILPSESENMLSYCRSGQLHLIKDAGHLVAYEKANEFNSILKKWLKEIDSLVFQNKKKLYNQDK